jgi:hypothetical protein
MFITTQAKPIVALTLAALVLSGCSTRLNPFNWFGGSEEVVVEEGEVNPLIPQRRGGIFQRPDAVYAGVPIEDVTSLRIERTRSGAIILAEGIAARQGPYQVQLTPTNPEDEPVDGVLSYTFDVIYPRLFSDVGPEATRRVTVARAIGNDELEDVRVIRVIGARNSRESRR